MATKKLPNELSITRVYDAPVKAVWDAWTDPKKAAKWWGPRGFTITTHSKELKPMFCLFHVDRFVLLWLSIYL